MYGVVTIPTCVKQPVIVAGHPLTQRYFFFKNRQLGQQDGGLQGVQPAVDAHTNVVVAPVLTVPGDLAHDFGQFVVIGEEGAAIAIAAQGLAGEEAGAGNGAEAAAFTSFVAGAKTLRGVFNHRDSVLGGNGVDGIEVGALAVQADGDDGFCAWRNHCFEQIRVQVVSAGVNVHIHRPGTEQGDGFSRSDISEARCDDFVARADAQRHLGNLQRVGAVGAGDAVLGAGVGGQSFFQLGDLRTQDVLAVVQHTRNSGVQLAFDADLLGFEVNEVNHGELVLWQAACWPC